MRSFVSNTIPVSINFAFTGRTNLENWLSKSQAWTATRLLGVHGRSPVATVILKAIFPSGILHIIGLNACYLWWIPEQTTRETKFSCPERKPRGPDLYSQAQGHLNNSATASGTELDRPVNNWFTSNVSERGSRATTAVLRPNAKQLENQLPLQKETRAARANKPAFLTWPPASSGNH